jgi:hypothetical protein
MRPVEVVGEVYPVTADRAEIVGSDPLQNYHKNDSPHENGPIFMLGIS